MQVFEIHNGVETCSRWSIALILDFRVVCVAEVCIVCVLVGFPNIANDGVRFDDLGVAGDTEEDLEDSESEVCG
jgi:hypothetical protein